jgi:glycerol-3-phosphate dehydrogenase (NAD(P)+)
MSFLFKDSSMDKVSIIGAGGWGTALAILVANNGYEVCLWSRNAEFADTLNRKRNNHKYLPGISIPGSIAITSELLQAANAEVILFATPSTALRTISQSLASSVHSGSSTVIISAVKGLEKGTGLRMSEILGSNLPGHPIAVLSGPNHAIEVARSVPTASVIGAPAEETGKRLQRILSAKTFRTYTSSDLVGIEIGGALKNIFAIAAGIGDGLGLGDNSKAALITRSLAELIRLGAALGGKRETFQGLSGVGDLIVTCFSRHSRNRGVGERLGRGETLRQIEHSMQMVAEGVPTARSAWECARKLGIKTPIIDEVFAILYENASPSEAIERLLKRELRPEED